MRTEDYLISIGGSVFPVDLSRFSEIHPDCASYISGANTPSEIPLNVVWSTWGEAHVREALATACLFRSVNHPTYPNMNCTIYVHGDPHVVSDNAYKAAKSMGINIICGGEAPVNKALFDVSRIDLITTIRGPVLYMDTDLYCLKPIDPKMLGGRIQTFGVGPGHTGGQCERIHTIIDTFMESTSTIYWRDAGMTLDDYEGHNFWPWIRINMGMIYADDGSSLADFASEFSELNDVFADTEYFGIGEMIFTAMHNKGDIQGHKFTWRNGWNKIWPWIANHDLKIETTWKDNVITCVHPSSKHEIIHMSHFAVKFYGNGDPRLRKFHMWMNDDGQILAHMAIMPRPQRSSGSFEGL